jgi:hypothetical protein
VRRRGCAEELCNQLQGQLEKARDDSLSLQKSILSLTQQASLPTHSHVVCSYFRPFLGPFLHSLKTSVHVL